MKYKCRPMSTKKKIILYCCKSNARQNTGLIGRVTEILFNIQNNTVKGELIYMTQAGDREKI